MLPLITFIVMIGAVAESREEFRPTARAMVGLQALIGFTLVAFAIRSAFLDPALNAAQAAREAILPVLLSVGTIPYVAGLRAAFIYDDLLWRIGWKQKVSRHFRHYAAARIMWRARFRPAEVRRFVQQDPFALFRLTHKSDLDTLLDENERPLR